MHLLSWLIQTAHYLRVSSLVHSVPWSPRLCLVVLVNFVHDQSPRTQGQRQSWTLVSSRPWEKDSADSWSQAMIQIRATCEKD